MYKVKVSFCSTMMRFCKERCSKFILQLSLLGLPFVYPLYADNIELVKDINVIPSPGSSVCSTPTYTNSLLFFCGASSNGEELWVSDDTSEGTLMIKDINVGSVSSSPRNLVNLNGIAYFLANDGASGDQLWRSDGTSLGTSVVKDLSNEGYIVKDLLVFNGELLLFAKSFNSSSTSNTYGKVWKSDGTEAGTFLLTYLSKTSDVKEYTTVNNTLYFVVNDYSFGGSTNLWKTNGSSTGTQLVKSFPGLTDGGTDTLDDLIDVNGTLFFSGNDSVTGLELWKSDGTNQGTILVKDINPIGSNWSSPDSFNNVNGILFFTAKNSVGRELWKSDGTEEGTFLVKDINPGTESTSFNSPVVLNDALYFSAFNGTSTSFWKSDGTEGGTTVVKSFGGAIVIINQFELSNGQIYFILTDHTNNIDSLWKSDGSTAGTVLLKSANKNSVLGITDVNGGIHFKMDDGVNGSELWTSNGTELGTVLVKDINTGEASSNIGTFPITYPVTSLSVNNFNRFFIIGNSSYFTADDGNNGRELWKSDGTSAGTFMIKDISNKSVSSNPELLTNVGGTLFFKADSNNSPEYDGLSYQVQELWKSDGTLEGTVLVKNIASSFVSRSIESLTAVNGMLYFTAVDNIHGRELWKSDGSESGTEIVKDISTGTSSSYPAHLTNVNDLLYFTTSSLEGFRLWKSDGTELGTVEIHDFANTPENLRNINNTLYFSAGYWNQFGSSDEYYELWKSDGTNLSTVKVAGGFTSPITHMTEVNGTIYFIANDGNTNKALWKTNGSGASLVTVVGFSNAIVSNMVSYNEQLFFATKELWKTDGSELGTEIIKDIDNNFNSYPGRLKVVNGVLYFTAHDSNHGRELWKSDGTWEGTELIKDIYSGSDPSFITNMTENNGILYFFADDGVHGSQLWKSDGSNPGTVQLTNSLSSGPRELKAFGNKLFLSVSTDQYGKELWAFTEGSDSDRDGIDDVTDNCPAISNADQLNTDGDSQGNICDDDDDGDGVLDDQDAFPLDASESIDTDSDGIGNNADLDDDNDLIPDVWEIDNGLNPLDANDASLDSDFDGVSNYDEYLAGTNPNDPYFSWDIDGDGVAEPLTDGLLFVRYYLGFRGNTLVDDVVGADAARTSSDEIEDYMSYFLAEGDIDGDDDVTALTDGVLLLRYLFRFRDDELIADAVDDDGVRQLAEEIESYIEQRMP